jgi:sulfite dehydrogenase (cytochrome) subunit B
MKRFLALVLLSVGFVHGADKGWRLPPETARLAAGPDVGLAAAQCMLCHSADYIATQPRMNRAAWTATVTKMREKYGAPISPDQIAILANYLVKTYGTEREPLPKK